MMGGYVYKGRIHDTDHPKAETDTVEYNRRNKTRPTTTRAATVERIKEAERLFAAGASQNHVHKTTGMSRATVRQYFPGQGWTKSQGAHLTNAKRRGE